MSLGRKGNRNRRRRASIAALPSLCTVKEECENPVIRPRSSSLDKNDQSTSKETNSVDKMENGSIDRCYNFKSKTLKNKSSALDVIGKDAENVKTAVSTYQLSYDMGDGNPNIVVNSDEISRYGSSNSLITSSDEDQNPKQLHSQDRSDSNFIVKERFEAKTSSGKRNSVPNELLLSTQSCCDSLDSKRGCEQQWNKILTSSINKRRRKSLGDILNHLFTSSNESIINSEKKPNSEKRDANLSGKDDPNNKNAKRLKEEARANNYAMKTDDDQVPNKDGVNNKVGNLLDDVRQVFNRAKRRHSIAGLTTKPDSLEISLADCYNNFDKSEVAADLDIPKTTSIIVQTKTTKSRAYRSGLTSPEEQSNACETFEAHQNIQNMSNAFSSRGKNMVLSRETQDYSDTVVVSEDISNSKNKLQSKQLKISNTSIQNKNTNSTLEKKVTLKKEVQNNPNTLALGFNDNKMVNEDNLQESSERTPSPNSKNVLQNNVGRNQESLKKTLSNTVQVVQRSPRTYTFTSLRPDSYELQRNKTLQVSALRSDDSKSDPRSSKLEAGAHLESSVHEPTLQTEKRFAALSEKYATLMANFTKDMKLRNKDSNLSKNDTSVLKLPHMEKRNDAEADGKNRSSTKAVADSKTTFQEEALSNVQFEDQKRRELSYPSVTSEALHKDLTRESEMKKPQKILDKEASSLHQGKITCNFSGEGKGPGMLSASSFRTQEVDSTMKTNEITVKEDLNSNSNSVRNLYGLDQEKINSRMKQKIVANEPSTCQKHRSIKIMTEDEIKNEKEVSGDNRMMHIPEPDDDSISCLVALSEKVSRENKLCQVSSNEKDCTPLSNTDNSIITEPTFYSSNNTNQFKNEPPEEQIEKTDNMLKESKYISKKRTTVVARLFARKFEQGLNRNQSHAVVNRRSKVYSTVGLITIPRTKLECEAARNIIETTKLNEPIKSEALTIRELLKGVDSHLAEEELLAVCRECTKTLKTLDALGSLPSYLSLDTVILNPSGTVKFKHLNTGVNIDPLYLAPEYDKRYVTEKTCVFSLAVTLWSAADWRLTDTERPNLSSQFRQLLVSMTEDVPDDRPCLERILLACETSCPDQMSSREQCQSLLWEYQAALALDAQALDKGAVEAEKKMKSQRDALIGSITVAASVKGFLKRQTSPLKDAIPSDELKKENSFDMQRNNFFKKDFERQANKETVSCSLDNNKNVTFNQGLPTDPTTKHSTGLSQEEKDRLLSLLLAEGSYSVPSKPPSPLNVSHNSMVFTPINPASGASTPTFVPVPYPVPTIAPQPTGSFWYMAPQSMVPPHTDNMVPAGSHVHSTSFDRETEESGRKFRSRSQVPRNVSPVSQDMLDNCKENTDRRTTGVTKNSRIPRPVWNASPARSRNCSNASTTINNQVINSNNTSLEDSSEYFESDTGGELFTDENRRSSSSYGGSCEESLQGISPSNPMRPASPIANSRCSTPTSWSLRNMNSQSGYSIPKGNRSRPASPGSRSSSPVAALISKFEDLSATQPDAGKDNKPTTVSSMISKLGSKSLLKEDRLTKKQFKSGDTSVSGSTATRPGPMRPSLAQDEYHDRELRANAGTRTWFLEQTSRDFYPSGSSSAGCFLEGSSALSTSCDSLPCRDDSCSTLSTRVKDKHNVGFSLSPENRQRLHSSLDNLYKREAKTSSKANTNLSSSPANRRKWSSLESILVSTSNSSSYGQLHKISSKRERLSSLENLSTAFAEDYHEFDRILSSVNKVIRPNGLSQSMENIARNYPDKEEANTLEKQKSRVSSTAGISISNFFSEANNSIKKEGDTTGYSTVGLRNKGTSPPERESSPRGQHCRTGQHSTKTFYGGKPKTISNPNSLLEDTISDSSMFQPSYMFQTPEKDNQSSNPDLSMFEYYTKSFDIPVNAAASDLDGKSIFLANGSKQLQNSCDYLASSREKLFDRSTEQYVSFALPSGRFSFTNRQSSKEDVYVVCGNDTIMEAERDIDFACGKERELKENVTKSQAQPLNKEIQTVLELTNKDGRSQDYLQRFEKRISHSGSESATETISLNSKAPRKTNKKDLASNLKRSPESSLNESVTKSDVSSNSKAKSLENIFANESKWIQDKKSASVKVKQRRPSLNLPAENLISITDGVLTFDDEKSKSKEASEVKTVLNHTKHPTANRTPNFDSTQESRSKPKPQKPAPTNSSKRRQSKPSAHSNRQIPKLPTKKSTSNPITPNVDTAKVNGDSFSSTKKASPRVDNFDHHQFRTEPTIDVLDVATTSKPNKVVSGNSSDYRNKKSLKNSNHSKNIAEIPLPSARSNPLSQESVAREGSYKHSTRHSSDSEHETKPQKSVKTAIYKRRQSSPAINVAKRVEKPLAAMLSTSDPTSPQYITQTDLKKLPPATISKQEARVRSSSTSPTLVQFFDRVKRTASNQSRPNSPANTMSRPKLHSTTSVPDIKVSATAQVLEFSFRDKSSPEVENPTDVCPSSFQSLAQGEAGTRNAVNSLGNGKSVVPSGNRPSSDGRNFMLPHRGKFPVHSKLFYEPTADSFIIEKALTQNLLFHSKNVSTGSNEQDGQSNSEELPGHIFDQTLFNPYTLKTEIKDGEKNIKPKLSSVVGPRGEKMATTKSMPNVFRENKHSDKNDKNPLHSRNNKKKISDGTLDKQTKIRPPSPNRLDSKELLGHLVKKVLTSAAAKQTHSPGSSFAAENTNDKCKSKQSNTSYSQNNGAVIRSENKNEKQILSGSVEKPATLSEKTERKVLLSSNDFSKAQCEKNEVSANGANGNSKNVLTTVSHAEPVSCNELQTQKSSGESVVMAVPTGQNNVLSTLVRMIQEEFAFDGYLDDGAEVVNMAEYVMSMRGLSEKMFREAITDQYSDLYWDEDLLQQMYHVVTPGNVSRSTLKFTPSTVSDTSRHSSVISLDSSSSELRGLMGPSVSRSSSGHSSKEIKDIVIFSLGEPAEFLSFKVIAPEIVTDIQDELHPIFEEYQKVMGGLLAATVEDLADKIEAKIMGIAQQLTLERRAKRKSVSSFNKLSEVDSKKDTVRDLATKLVREIEESDKKIVYLKSVLWRLRCVYAERFGLDVRLLHSFVTKFNNENQTLEPQRNNTFLSFSPLWDQRSVEECRRLNESTKGPSLQYGTEDGLFSYLFARHAMTQAYVRYFFYTFRYFATPEELFAFIRDKCSASLRANSEEQTLNHQLQIRYRALELLTEWVDGYYAYDFRDNDELLKKLLSFLRDEFVVVDKSERGMHLIDLISDKQKMDNSEEMSDSVSLIQLHISRETSPSFKKEISRKRDSKKSNSTIQCLRRGSLTTASSYKPSFETRSIQVMDHTSKTLAEQLTLIQQDLFSDILPVHFLNSRALGVGVGRSSPSRSSQKDTMLGFSTGIHKTTSLQTLTTDNPDGQHSTTDNLYASQPTSDGFLVSLLEHAQDVIMWVAVEICSAPSVKVQVAFISKFVSIAKHCYEMRNFAACMQILDALEMFVVRQLPVWKQVPSKVTEQLEELNAIKVLLKTDSTWLLQGESWREKPTIPCTLLFLMHVQQLELGGFVLANGMYKWSKMRSIARLADQIRLFKQMSYAFEPNPDLKARIKQRIMDCQNENLHHLAAENSANFYSLSGSHSSRKFQNALKKMKATFGHS